LQDADYSALEQAINDFDFDAALEKLKSVTTEVPAVS